MVDFANFRAYEGTLTGDETITFPWRNAYRVMIMNDSTTKNLSFKFHDEDDFATLKPTETISLGFRCKEVIVTGSNVEYRVWLYG